MKRYEYLTVNTLLYSVYNELTCKGSQGYRLAIALPPDTGYSPECYIRLVFEREQQSFVNIPQDPK